MWKRISKLLQKVHAIEERYNENIENSYYGKSSIRKHLELMHARFNEWTIFFREDDHCGLARSNASENLYYSRSLQVKDLNAMLSCSHPNYFKSLFFQALEMLKTLPDNKKSCDIIIHEARVLLYGSSYHIDFGSIRARNTLQNLQQCSFTI